MQSANQPRDERVPMRTPSQVVRAHNFGRGSQEQTNQERTSNMKANSTKTNSTKTNSAREGAKTRTRPISDMADSAMRNYEQAIRTGLKLQEEAGRCITAMLNQTASAPDWQKQMANVTGMANSLMPLAQRRMEEVMNLMEKNSRTSAELMKIAVDAAQTPVIANSQAKWMEFWASSIGAVRSNAEAMTEMSAKAMDAWINFVQKNTEVTEIRVPKAA